LAGASREEILGDYTLPEGADITAALEYAAQSMDNSGPRVVLKSGGCRSRHCFRFKTSTLTSNFLGCTCLFEQFFVY